MLTLPQNIPALMHEASVPGLSITLIRDGHIAWTGTFGTRNRTTGEPVTANTLFEAASLSKPVYAYAVLTLCQEGTLDLDTPVVDYMRDDMLSVTIANATSTDMQRLVAKSQLQGVTPHHLLSHTAGFPNWPSEERALRTHFPPGARFSYSGTGFAVLQSIVERITGQPAVDFVQARVLDPLGMAHSRFTWNGAETGQEGVPLALGHDEAGQPTDERLWPEMIAAASLHSTPADFARFMRAVMRPAADTLYPLSPEWIAAMLTPQIQVNDSAVWHEDWPRPEITLNQAVGWGLGWGIQQTDAGNAFWQWGDNGTYKNFAIGWGEEGTGLVIMTNGQNGMDVYRRILVEIVGEGFPSIEWLMSL